MGASKLAEGLKDGTTKEEAQKILDDFYKSFSGIASWKKETEKFVSENGYVEDLWGRIRRLPDVFLPEYEFYMTKDIGYKDKVRYSKSRFNPFFGSLNLINPPENPIITKYKKQIKSVKYNRDKKKIIEAAEKEGVTIIDNGGKIGDAFRQATNARIQGSAATMSKKAMIAIYNDPVMKDLGFKMLIPVHDEIIGECPSENAEKASQRLSELMMNAGKPECQVPMKCDAVIESRWYESEYLGGLHKDYKDKLKSGLTREQAIEAIKKETPEATIFNLEEELK